MLKVEIIFLDKYDKNQLLLIYLQLNNDMKIFFYGIRYNVASTYQTQTFKSKSYAKSTNSKTVFRKLEFHERY